MTTAARALLLARDDRHHPGIEADLAPRVIPWLAAAGIHATHTTDRTVMSPDGLRDYDLFLPWLIPQYESGLSNQALAAQAQAVADFVHRGGALLAFHGATVVPDPEPYRPYVDLVGTRFKTHPKYQEFPVHITAPDHPITHGLDDFRTSDELYLHEPLAPDAGVLATADWEGATHPMVYTRRPGRGALAYIALGHNAATWDHPAFHHLVVNAARWLLHQTRP